MEYDEDGVALPPHYKHECNLCGKRFITPSKLSRHMLSHTGERPHTCQFCLRQFSQLSNMKLHILKIHGVDMDCMVISDTFSPSGHHGDPPGASTTSSVINPVSL